MIETTPDLRIGILGTGRIVPAALIAPARQTPGVTVVAVAGRNVVRATAFAKAHGVPNVHPTFDALLASPEVDAVYLALPPLLHEQWAARALAAGKHVLCEKPMATNAAAAAALVAAAETAGVRLHEAMHLRYLSRLHRQRELVAGGRLGALRQVTATFRLPRVPMTPSDHRLHAEIGGGAALDVGCYAVSCARYIANEEPSVEWSTAKLIAPNVDRWMQARLRFPSGAVGTVECGFRGWYLAKISIEATCERGWVKWGRDGLICDIDGQRVHESTVPDWTYQRQLTAFARSARGLPSEAVPASDAVATLKVLDAMYLRAGLTLRGSESNREPLPSL